MSVSAHDNKHMPLLCDVWKCLWVWNMARTIQWQYLNKMKTSIRIFSKLSFPKTCRCWEIANAPYLVNLILLCPQPIDGINLVFHNTCRTIASKFDESGQWQRSTSQISALCNDSSTITHTFTILLLLCGVNSHHRCTLMRACEDVWPITLPQRLKEG